MYICVREDNYMNTCESRPKQRRNVKRDCFMLHLSLETHFVSIDSSFADSFIVTAPH